MRSDICRTLSLPVDRRRFLRGAALGTAGLALAAGAGCGSTTAGSTPQGGGTQSTAGAGAATPQPVRGGTLTITGPADIVPKYVPHMLTSGALMTGLYNRVVYYKDTTLETVNELADSLKFSPDYTSLTIKLRSDVKFHTGRALTADDVKWNIELVANPLTGSQLMNLAKWVQKFDIPDPNTLTLTFDRARPAILDLFHCLFIADPQTWQESQDGKRMVGTGPFMFKEWVPGDHITLVRNPNYWKSGLPYLDEITTKVIPDAQARLLNLQTGAVDIASSLDPRDTKGFQSQGKFKVYQSPVMSGVWSLGCNVKVPPFGDKRVRQAVARLIDRKGIVDNQLFFGEPMGLPWDKYSPAYVADIDKSLAYDPAKAKELLTQAGALSGVSTSITVTPGYAETLAMAEMLQAELTKMGWKVDVQKVDGAEMSTKTVSGAFPGLWMQMVSFMYMTPSTLFVMAFPYRVPNISNFDTPEYRKLVDDIQYTTDENALKKVYQDIDRMLADECFFDSIAPYITPLVSSANLNGFRFMRGSFPYVEGAWKTK